MSVILAYTKEKWWGNTKFLKDKKCVVILQKICKIYTYIDILYITETTVKTTCIQLEMLTIWNEEKILAHEFDEKFHDVENDCKIFPIKDFAACNNKSFV